MQQRPFWFFLNVYGWVIFGLSIITAIFVGQAWIVLLGVIGYLIALLADLVGGGSLGRTGAVRLARVEQENRELRAEQRRLIGAIQEKDGLLASQKIIDLAGKTTLPPPPANDPTPEKPTGNQAS